MARVFYCLSFYRNRLNTIILVTHEHDIAMLAHRVIFLRVGKIEKDERIITETKNPGTWPGFFIVYRFI